GTRRRPARSASCRLTSDLEAPSTVDREPGHPADCRLVVAECPEVLEDGGQAVRPGARIAPGGTAEQEAEAGDPHCRHQHAIAEVVGDLDRLDDDTLGGAEPPAQRAVRGERVEGETATGLLPDLALDRDVSRSRLEHRLAGEA